MGGEGFNTISSMASRIRKECREGASVAMRENEIRAARGSSGAIKQQEVPQVREIFGRSKGPESL
jgi:hypothetical protein